MSNKDADYAKSLFETEEKNRKLKKEEKRGLFVTFLKLSGPYKLTLILSLICMLIGNFLDLLVPYLVGKAIELIVGINNVDFDGILRLAIIMIVVAVVNLVFTWLYNLLANIFTYKTSENIRKKFFDKINKVPIKFVDGTTHGDLLNRLINDTEIVTDGLVEAVISVSSGLFTIIGTLVFMIILNVKLAIIVALLTPVSLICAYIIAKKSSMWFTLKAKATGDMSGYLEEIISNQRIVKAFGHEDESIETFKEINYNECYVARKSKFYTYMAPPFTRLVNGIVYIVVGFFGAIFYLQGSVTIGIISSFLSYANSYGRPFEEISSEITEIQAAYASARRILAVLNEANEPSDEGFKELSYADGTISIRNMSFSYSPKTKLLQNFNLEVSAGQKIAIVGPTGCGKTTLINLLMRFYEIDEGQILISGEDTKMITRASLRNKFGMVLQDSWLFHGSIRDNISYGNQMATDEEIIEAAKKAGAHDFIQKFPNGYDTQISEGGTNISQGQKQLICIARVMLLNPAMLILDEATSNIDTRNEMKVQKAFETMMEGRTSFIVAHRLSTIQNADVILVMNKGNVIEQGTHEELLKKRGFYYNLYNSQFKH